MKKNKVFVYALTVSIIIHILAISYILNVLSPKIKKAKKHVYTKPVIVEPYNFIKNYLKNAPKPKYASTKIHKALKNTRLNAPPNSQTSVAAPSSPNQNQLQSNSHNANKSAANTRTISSAHIFSKSSMPTQKREQLSSISSINEQIYNNMNNIPSVNSNGVKNQLQNPSNGIKSATVNLNTTTIKYASYLLHIKEKIENVWEYPTKAQREGIDGVLVIKFSINKNGSVYNATILRSSGKKILDKAAIKAIYDAARYDPFPKYWTINRLNIIGTFVYRLNNFFVF